MSSILNLRDPNTGEFISIPAIKGEKGEPGPAGPAGIAGPTGPQGLKGEAGPQGPQGNVGPQGPKGEIGPMGPKGADGTMTFEDLTPEQKESLKGDKGDRGIQGPTGPMGPRGEQGPKGDVARIRWRGQWNAETVYFKDDAVFHNGDSFIYYETTSSSGVEPDPERARTASGSFGDQMFRMAKMLGDVAYPWMIIASKGKDGEQGPVGPKGDIGPQGERGMIGSVGPRGEQGFRGPGGPTGPEGPQGPQGVQGPKGDTPVKGVDYFTQEEVDDIVSQAQGGGGSFQTDWGTLPAPQPVNINGFNIHILGVYNTSGTLISARSAITEIRFYNINDKDLVNEAKPTAEYRKSSGSYATSTKMFDGGLSIIDSDAYLSDRISINEAEELYKVSFPSNQEVAKIEVSITGPMGGTGYYKGVIIKSKDGQTLFEDRDLRIENIDQTLSFVVAKIPQNRNSMMEVSFLKSVGVPKAYVGVKGQVVVDINANSIYLMDGVNPGGKLIGGEALVNKVEELNQKIAYMEGRFNTLLALTQRGE